MDPDDTLAEIRRITDLFREGITLSSVRMSRAESIVNLVDDLDQWLSKGGFLPRDWNK